MATLNAEHRSRALLGVLVVLHLMLVSHQVEDGGGRSLLQRALFTALHPLQYAVARTVRVARDAWIGYADLRGVHQENRRLAAERDRLRLELQALRAGAEESLRLRALLDMQRQLPAPGVAADVIARGGLPWYRTLLVARGSEAGVQLNAAAVSPDGLVGRVIAVASGASKVQALLDRDAGVGVVVERSRVTGIVSGQVGVADTASPLLVLKYVPARADVQAGDALVTSGLDRLFPPGLPVGEVLEVRPGSGLFLDILVRPWVRFDALEVLLLLPVPSPPALAAEEPR